MADLIIVPIFYGGGVKTKLIEAGCFGKPVVATTQGVKGTVYRDNADLLIADDVLDFGRKCMDVLLNNNEYSSMGNHMRDTTRSTYMWDVIGRRYHRVICSIYNDVLEGRRQVDYMDLRIE